MHRMFRSLIVLSAFVASCFAQSQHPASSSVQDVLTNWRRAVHAEKAEHSKLAMLASQSNEDGIPGKVEEWITTAEQYRSQMKRDYDDDVLVVTGQLAMRRDWNGFVRAVQGRELSRLRTEILERRLTVFGPPTEMPEAAASLTDDKKMYLVRMTPPGGSPMTWFVDTTTWLPVKSVRPGDDSEITSTYEDWRETGGVKTPHRVKVAETDKPDYERRQVSLSFEKAIASGAFNPPVQGPSDALLEPGAPPIPFTLESNHIVFKVRLNGHEPIGFLFDTGADENVINTHRLPEFGLKTYSGTMSTGGGGSAEYDYATGATFTMSGAELRNQHVAVVDLTGLESALGIPLGGLLGYEFISRFVVEIDYEKKLLTLHDAKTWSYSGAGYVVPIAFDDGIPFTDGTISVGPKRDIPAYFVIDFGAAETMTLTSPFVRANDLEKLAQTNPFVNRPAGLENQFFAQNNVRGHIDRLVLGDLTEQSIPVNLSVNVKGAYASANFSGTIGQSIFQRYHVFLDYARNRVIFEPTAETQVPFPERKTYGLTLLASGPDLHTYTVTAVRPGSQAERDGFKKSDVISGLNHKSASEFTLSNLREKLTHEGESCDVEVMRANDKLTIGVQIKLVSLDKA
jgi:Aspartyl protease